MVKSKKLFMKKMKVGISKASEYHGDALDEARDPLDVIAEDPDKYAKRQLDGVAEAHRLGKYQSGTKKAKDRDSWRKSKDRAVAHYGERADDMVEHAAEDYDVRKGIMEECDKVIKDMPKATTSQREARGAAYRKCTHEKFAAMKGLKA